eukprot:TRINITY_DN14034_c0_g1_i1.p1 TRINITY_DN14034_c0_g1~~TRINITY_DN14034_c0_g1_i1.p1  ORF type:complete len:181 (-),score=73.78 TRINITY_DN14034_c0_g1_i1:457-999(-)
MPKKAAEQPKKKESPKKAAGKVQKKKEEKDNEPTSAMMDAIRDRRKLIEKRVAQREKEEKKREKEVLKKEIRKKGNAKKHTHPPYANMIKAILKEKEGKELTGYGTIVKRINEKFDVPDSITRALKNALGNLHDDGVIVQVRNSYRLSQKKTSKRSRSKSPAKKRSRSESPAKKRRTKRK